MTDPWFSQTIHDKAAEIASVYDLPADSQTPLTAYHYGIAMGIFMAQVEAADREQQHREEA